MSKHVPPPTGTPIAGPELTQDSLAARLATQAAEREEALQRLRSLRKEAADEIDRLLDFLDESDIDPDLEPTLGFMNGPAEMDECETPEDGEPSLASLDRMADQTRWAEGGMMDAELDESDDEPSLGSLSSHGHGDQSVWGRPGEGGVDAEDEHDGREPYQDEEPSLGSTATINQEAWAFGNNVDREQGTTRRFREEPKPVSICNVTPIPGAEWKVD
jgi:hypothetical protein